MVSDLDRLKEVYRLSEKRHKAIADDIIQQNTIGITREDEPTVIILGGQPGAGKGELTSAAVALLKGNVVICNADDYRDSHPFSEEIKEKHEEYYPDITVEYSHAWNNLLVENCIERKLNFILETTFSSGNNMNDTIRRFRSNGFKVLIMLIAVSSRLSYLGTRLRFENMKANFGYGRLVDKQVHDDKFNMVENTLRLVSKAGLYDEIFIYGRAGRQKVKGTKNGLTLVSKGVVDPIDSYLRERDKSWSENDKKFFMFDVFGLLRMMIVRRASHTELEEMISLSDGDDLWEG